MKNFWKRKRDFRLPSLSLIFSRPLCILLLCLFWGQMFSRSVWIRGRFCRYARWFCFWTWRCLLLFHLLSSAYWIRRFPFYLGNDSKKAFRYSRQEKRSYFEKACFDLDVRCSGPAPSFLIDAQSAPAVKLSLSASFFKFSSCWFILLLFPFRVMN